MLIAYTAGRKNRKKKETILMNRKCRLLLISAIYFVMLSSTIIFAQPGGVLKIGDGKDWFFSRGAWKDGSENTILPPAMNPGLEGVDYYAFYKKYVYGDLEVKFKFHVQSNFVDLGLIVRAQSPDNFYLIHFPVTGQSARAKNYWAAVSKRETNGYIRNIKFALVPQIVCEANTWHDIRIIIKANTISFWIDEHACAPVYISDIPKNGRIGLYGYGPFEVKSLRVKGQARQGGFWNTNKNLSKNWFYPIPDKTLGYWQWHPQLAKTPKGDLLVFFAAHPEDAKLPKVLAWSRSKNKGRTWSKPQKLTLKLESNDPKLAKIFEQWSSIGFQYAPAMTTTHEGRLILQVFANPFSTKGESQVYGDLYVFMSESNDDGESWQPLRLIHQWKKPANMAFLSAWNNFLELNDGTLLRFSLGNSVPVDKDWFDWGAVHFRAFSIRSIDGGKTWSTPVNLDAGNGGEKKEQRLGNLDLTEPQCAEVEPGKVLCLIRPTYSPTMWETWSYDGGASWAPTTIGPITGYAACMLRTASGALVLGHRYPGLTINVSRDNGISWSEQVMIDFASWANGAMIEVEPNVVLYMYITDTKEGFFRAQYFRVTPKRIEPVKFK